MHVIINCAAQIGCLMRSDKPSFQPAVVLLAVAEHRPNIVSTVAYCNT